MSGRPFPWINSGDPQKTPQVMYTPHRKLSRSSLHSVATSIWLGFWTPSVLELSLRSDYPDGNPSSTIRARRCGGGHPTFLIARRIHDPQQYFSVVNCTLVLFGSRDRPAASACLSRPSSWILTSGFHRDCISRGPGFVRCSKMWF